MARKSKLYAMHTGKSRAALNRKKLKLLKDSRRKKIARSQKRIWALQNKMAEGFWVGASKMRGEIARLQKQIKELKAVK